jgi:hypothetical protein
MSRFYSERINPYLFVILFILFTEVIGRPMMAQQPMLVVKKQTNNSQRIVRPDKPITIVLQDGTRYTGKGFQLVENNILLNNADTISLDQIIRLRARVYGNKHKIAGLLIASTGLAVATGGLSLWSLNTWGEYSGPGPFIYVLPGLIITAVGINKIVSSRDFVASRWDYIISSDK